MGDAGAGNLGHRSFASINMQALVLNGFGEIGGKEWKELGPEVLKRTKVQN